MESVALGRLHCGACPGCPPACPGVMAPSACVDLGSLKTFIAIQEAVPGYGSLLGGMDMEVSGMLSRPQCCCLTDPSGVPIRQDLESSLFLGVLGGLQGCWVLPRRVIP